MVLESIYPEIKKPGKHFIYLIYRFHDDLIEVDPRNE